MALTRLIKVLLFAGFVQFCYGEGTKVVFDKCGTKGFACANSAEFSERVDIVFQCNTNVTGQNVTIDLWKFHSPNNISSLTIQNCERVRLCLTCTGDDRLIQWLKIQNVEHLDIIPAEVAHSPPKFILENITSLDTIPRQTFSQIQQRNRPRCNEAENEIKEIFFRNVNIGTIETEAFWNLTNMKNFSWVNVTVNRIQMNAIQLTFSDGLSAGLHGCDLNIMEPLAFRITVDGFFVTHSKFGNIWGSGFNGSMATFVFNNNTVANIQAGAISILTKRAYMIDNHFDVVESGAFQKIGPGLLRDSKMNFANLRFVYMFSQNYLQTVVNGGVEPDLASYKNVASDVTYANNVMQVFMRTPSHEHQQRTNIIWN